MKHRWKKTVAMMMSALALTSGSASASVPVSEANQTVNANKQALTKIREEKRSITRINDMGGVEFERMRIAHVNPIFEPRKHTVQSYRSQQRNGKALRKQRAKARK